MSANLKGTPIGVGAGVAVRVSHAAAEHLTVLARVAIWVDVDDHGENLIGVRSVTFSSPSFLDGEQLVLSRSS